ncbi:MAG: hypothetical protein IPJ06_15300 [Saprospiraceae bacterium]|nr:hypothetical protein [Saprospiraceae bacterium]
MKYILTLLCTACLSISLSAQSNDIQQAAQAALRDMQQLVNGENYKMIGLDSPDALKGASTGSPIAIQVIGLEAVRKFQGSQNEVQSILEAHNRVFVPVLSNGKVISAIALDKSDKGWKTASLGMAAPIEEYNKVIRENNLDDKAYMVWVPSLNQYFVARGQGSNLQFASIGQSVGDQSRGKFVSASDALKLLQPVAQQYNGLPW